VRSQPHTRDQRSCQYSGANQEKDLQQFHLPTQKEDVALCISVPEGWVVRFGLLPQLEP